MHPYHVQAIVSGHHADPFSILGPHQSESGTWEVRIFQPQVKEAWLVTEHAEIPLKREHPHGLFAGRLDSDPGHYRLRLHWWREEITVAEDPYRFPPILTPFELHLHAEGTNHESYRTLGAHLAESEGVTGVRFAVWAPEAEVVSVVGDFNRWDRTWHPMRLREAGIWEIFIPGLGAG